MTMKNNMIDGNIRVYFTKKKDSYDVGVLD